MRMATKDKAFNTSAPRRAAERHSSAAQTTGTAANRRTHARSTLMKLSSRRMPGAPAYGSKPAWGGGTRARTAAIREKVPRLRGAPANTKARAAHERGAAPGGGHKPLYAGTR